VFDSRVLRRIFGPKRVKVTPIIREIKSKRMEVGHVACMVEV